MGGHGSMRTDPAIERWNRMREEAYLHYRWTPRTTWVAFVGIVLVPGTIYYLASMSDLRWNWAGKRRGESLRSVPQDTE